MAKAKGRKVDQFDKDGGNYIQTYVSISDAARNVGVSVGCIRFVLIGKTKTGGGFIWKYHIEPEPKMENEIIYDS